MISAIGLAGALALLIFLTVRGVHILIAAPLCAAIVAATSGIAWLPPLATEGAPDYATAYMAGFTGFFADWFFMFLLGAILSSGTGRRWRRRRPRTPEPPSIRHRKHRQKRREARAMSTVLP